MRLILIVAVILAQIAVAAAQPAPDGDQEEDGLGNRLRQHVFRLFKSFRQLSDWDTHSAYMLDAMDKVYERNEWDSESDQFSLMMIHEINAIPPWQPLERFNRLTGLVSERYDLDESQEQLLRDTLIRESNEMFQRHSGRIMSYVVDAIQTRAAGEAFTAEQVARWVQTAEPVFLESRQRMNSTVQRLMPELDEAQRELVQQDLDALNHRMDDIYEMGERWFNGQWQPSDWGMEDDPIQLAGEARVQTDSTPDRSEDEPADSKPGPAAGGGRSEPAEAQIGDTSPLDRRDRSRTIGPPKPRGNDPWARYVERFIKKYKLEEAQQTQAWKIYRDLKAQADKLRSRYGQRIEEAGQRVKKSADESSRVVPRELEAKLKTSLDKLFEQLKERLKRLPTRAQRRNAGPDDLDKSTDKKVKQPVNPVENVGP